MPARRYRVSPRQRPGRPGFVATFRDHAGERRNRGLATESRAEAELICAALVRLHDAGAPAADAPRDLPAKALELYYGEALPPSIPQAPLVEPDEEPLDLPPLEAAYVSGLQHELAAAHADRDRLRAERDQARAELAALKASMLGRAAEAAERCPPMPEAIAAYKRHLEGSVTPQSAREYLWQLEGFLEGRSFANPAHISAEALGAYLDEFTEGAAKPTVRRRKARIKLGRFLNWATKTWGFPSPMPSVPGPKSGAVQRERGEIHWHSLAEVDAALEAIGEPYWRAVVGTLAFAGLQLAELAWLSPADLQKRKGGGLQLWIAPLEGHQLKTAQRRRAVGVHPRLAELLEAHAPGKRWLFAIPADVKRRARSIDRDPEQWRVDTLGRHLAKRLPDGMDARSLRRTFGSLLLRSGKTAEQVAAAMGNSPAIVHAHYARIIGSEVEVDF